MASSATAKVASSAAAAATAARARAAIARLDATSPKPAPASPYLRDRHGRQHTYLRMSLTERCNLRCLYCMPEEGVPLTPREELLTTPEVLRLAGMFVGQGVDKIRLTGGEPTVRKDLVDIVAGLNELRPRGLRQIGMTSNGLALSRKLPSLVSGGLSHLNLSLDTLDPFKFELMTRRPGRGFQAVRDSIDTALALGMESVKLNVVVIKGLNDGEDILDFVRFTENMPVTVRFIEYMPFDGNRWHASKLVPYQHLLTHIRTKFGELERLEDDSNDTSKHWRVPGHTGKIAFITSMTDHFCGTCNRLRITADGSMKVCLFGNTEVSLRDILRDPSSGLDDEYLLSIVGAAVGRKHKKHAGMSDIEALAREAREGSGRPMITIGTRPRIPRFNRHMLGSLMSRAPPVSRITARMYSSSSGRRSDDHDSDPWAVLDGSVDGGHSSAAPSSSAPPGSEDELLLRALQEHTAAVRGQDAQSPPQQSWSAYMGDESDDSPWASIDAIADGFRADDARRADGAHGAQSSASSYQSEPVIVPVTTPSPSPSGSTGRPADQSQRLTHVTDTNQPGMVSVSSKQPTQRSATAAGRVLINELASQLVRRSELSGDASPWQDGDHALRQARASFKGPVLQTAQLAGIMGAKRTSELIPLCHGILIDTVNVQLKLVSSPSTEVPSPHIFVTCTATSYGSTGVEMEALVGVQVACATLWDMLKSVAGKEMVVADVKVVRKSGGKSGDWARV